MNNKELADALRAIDKRQTECECRHYCCGGCECWDESCEDECKVLVQAADTLEKASDYEKILADFSKVVNDGFQAMKEQKEEKPDQDNQNPGEPKSNGDQFRSMSDYELADTMLHMAACWGHCPPGKDYFSCNGDFPCKDCWLEWIQQPAEEVQMDNMKKLIYADDLQARLVRKKPEACNQRFTDGFNDALMRFKSMIHSAPAVDAVPVVRCRKCKHFDWLKMQCGNDAVSTDNEGGALYSLNFYLDDFCSYGEPKEDAHG